MKKKENAPRKALGFPSRVIIISCIYSVSNELANDSTLHNDSTSNSMILKLYSFFRLSFNTCKKKEWEGDGKVTK